MSHNESSESFASAPKPSEQPSDSLFSDAYNKGIVFAIEHHPYKAAATGIAAAVLFASRGRIAAELFGDDSAGEWTHDLDGSLRSKKIPPLMDGPELSKYDGYVHSPFRTIDRPINQPILRMATKDGRELLPPGTVRELALSSAPNTPTRALGRTNFLTEVLREK